MVPINITKDNGQIDFTPIYPSIYINNQKITPQDIPIKITPNVVLNPTSITFMETRNTVDLTKPNPQGYLVTSFPNSIVLSDGKNQEFISLDTTIMNRSTFYVATNIKSGINSVKVVIPKIKSSLSYDNVLSQVKYQIDNPEADGFRPNDSYVKTVKSSGQIQLTAKGTSDELAFYIDNLPHSGDFIMKAQTKYTSGLPTMFYTNNSFEDKAEVVTQLSKTNQDNWIVLPKSENYYAGYGFHFTEQSMGSEIAQASIGKIELMPFPAEFLRNLRLVKSNDEPIINKFNEKNPISFVSLGLSAYLVSQNLPSNSYLILSQAYDAGWSAYKISGDSFLNKSLPFIFGKKITDHVVINNWENGWILSDGSTGQVVITYLPQYFEYIGFGIVIFVGLYLLIKSAIIFDRHVTAK